MNIKLYDISEWCKLGVDVREYPYIGEVDRELSIGEILKVGEEYFSIGCLDLKNKCVGVSKVKIDFEPVEKVYEGNIVCPYCNYEYRDSWELEDDSEGYECRRCGAVISYERVVTVEYNSYPVKPPSTINANWIK